MFVVSREGLDDIHAAGRSIPTENDPRKVKFVDLKRVWSWNVGLQYRKHEGPVAADNRFCTDKSPTNNTECPQRSQRE